MHLNSPKYKFHLLSPKAVDGLSSESSIPGARALVPINFPEGFEALAEHVIGILPNKLLVFLNKTWMFALRPYGRTQVTSLSTTSCLETGSLAPVFDFAD